MQAKSATNTTLIQQFKTQSDNVTAEIQQIATKARESFKDVTVQHVDRVK
jgi:hypothetical protein